jgi:hypothetical protein
MYSRVISGLIRLISALNAKDVEPAHPAAPRLHPGKIVMGFEGMAQQAAFPAAGKQFQKLPMDDRRLTSAMTRLLPEPRIPAVSGASS